MLETDALQGIVQLDIDTQIVRVELELVTFFQAAILIDMLRERGDGPRERQPPVPVIVRVGIENHRGGSATLYSFGDLRHGCFPRPISGDRPL